MLTTLSEIQIKLAEQLLISVKKKEPTIYYEELAQRINPPIFHRHVGKNIGEVSRVCHELGLPLISAKVINKGTKTAGEGFYPLYKMYGIDTQGFSEKELFKLELKKIRECTEWYKLADYLGIQLDLPRPNSEDEAIGSVPAEIRVLPMSKNEEFPEWSIVEVQQNYFLKDLIEQEGYYYYRKVGMQSANGSLVLFQFDNAIIAAARLLDVEKYETPVDGLYYGAYIFDANSVSAFEPITYDELHAIDTDLAPFSQVKQIISRDYLDAILDLIQHKKNPILAEELPAQDMPLYIEGAKKQIVVNAYERNYKARQECIKHKGAICLICGFDFGKFYGKELQGKIHVHHIKALAEIDGEYQLDPLNDLIPVCPNCHLALHSKPDGAVYGVENLKKAIREQQVKQ